MTVLDTSVLIEAVSVVPGSPIPGRMRQFIADGERLAVPSFVFYEFLRGPRRPEEMWTLNHRDFADIPGLRLVEPGNSGRR